MGPDQVRSGQVRSVGLIVNKQRISVLVGYMSEPNLHHLGGAVGRGGPWPRLQGGCHRRRPMLLLL
jgi:hypothetical protein